MSSSSTAPKPRHPGSEALLRKFPDEQARTEYFQQLASKSHEGRIVLSDAERDGLVSAYRLLEGIVARNRARPGLPDTSATAERSA